MKPTKYPQYTKNWTNVFVGWNTRIPLEAIDWVLAQEGGEVHIHASGHAIKFERKQDAEWFILRWL